MSKKYTIYADIRQQMGFSRRFMAEFLGVNYFTWSRWERGERTPPPHVTRWICLSCGLDPLSLHQSEDEKEKQSDK